jgi:hypothetical protein
MLEEDDDVLHVYELAPETFNDAVSPAHKLAFPVIDKEGKALTVIVCDAIALQEPVVPESE